MYNFMALTNDFLLDSTTIQRKILTGEILTNFDNSSTHQYLHNKLESCRK